MKYEEIVQSVRESFSSADVSYYKKHLAIQFNITGEGEGAFYVEIKNGTIDVQPYEYYDRDVIFTMSAQDLFAMIDGTLDSTKAYLNGQIGISNVTNALEVKKIIDNIKAQEEKAKAEAEKLAKQKAKEEEKAKAEAEKLAQQKAKEEEKAKAEAEKLAQQKAKEENVKAQTTATVSKKSTKTSRKKK